MAKIALLYSSVFGNEAYESLLQFMSTEKNDPLDELTDDFVEICNRFNPRIELVCAYEQVAMQVVYSEKIVPALLSHSVFMSGVRSLMDFGLSSFGAGTVSSERFLKLHKSDSSPVLRRTKIRSASIG